MGKLDEDLDLRDPEGFYVKKHIYPHSIWTQLYEKESFQEHAAQKYCTTVKPILDKLMDVGIDIWKERMQDSFRMDWNRWDGEHKKEADYSDQKYMNTYEEAYEELKIFAKARGAFLYQEWYTLCLQSASVDSGGR